MTRRPLFESLTLALALSATAFACQQPTVDAPAPTAVRTGPQQELRIKLVGIGEPKGSVRVAIFEGADAFGAGRQYAGTFSAVTGSEMIVLFAVPQGTWGISSFHDVNDNGELDANMVGMPTEPFAFSNNATGDFGPPGFDQIAFSVGDEPVAMEIDLR
jgi:uncharacterized protein (DUF2141 family)